MSHTFTHRYDMLINAAPEAIYDYVTNPNSWPEWLAASHRIESPDRPLGAGETFREIWRTKTGEAELNWVITAAERPSLWIGETGTNFLGPIIVRYDFVVVSQATRYTRTVTNPDRPKPAPPETTSRMDAEAEVGMGNVKRILEART